MDTCADQSPSPEEVDWYLEDSYTPGVLDIATPAQRAVLYLKERHAELNPKSCAGVRWAENSRKIREAIHAHLSSAEIAVLPTTTVSKVVAIDHTTEAEFCNECDRIAEMLDWRIIGSFVLWTAVDTNATASRLTEVYRSISTIKQAEMFLDLVEREGARIGGVSSRLFRAPLKQVPTGEIVSWITNQVPLEWISAHMEGIRNG